MVKVLFVCTGNICRSPTAAGIMRAHIARLGLADRIEADSAGTHGYHRGEPPDSRSAMVAKRHGVDIGDLRSRQLTADDFASADILAAMERRHENQLRTLCPPGLEHRIRLLMSFAPEGGLEDVPDPYYGNDGFETVFRMIERGVLGLLDHIRQAYLEECAPLL